MESHSDYAVRSDGVRIKIADDSIESRSSSDGFHGAGPATNRPPSGPAISCSRDGQLGTIGSMSRGADGPDGWLQPEHIMSL